MTCKHDVKRVTIDPSLLADDKDMLEDLVAAAFNAAVRKAEETRPRRWASSPPACPGCRRHEVPVLMRALWRAAFRRRCRGDRNVRLKPRSGPTHSNMPDTHALEALIQACGRLPGVGVKSARAWRFTCCSTTAKGAQVLARRWRRRWRRCATARVPHLHRGEVCATCLDPRRDADRLCVVETPADQAALERTAPSRACTSC
jgi:hypothetical protein